MNKDKLNFGEELRRLREQKEFSVNQLALYSGVSAAHISRLERGLRPAPTPDVIRKLAKGLSVPYEQLMEAAGYLPAKNGNGKTPWYDRDEPPTDIELEEIIENENIRLFRRPIRPLLPNTEKSSEPLPCLGSSLFATTQDYD